MQKLLAILRNKPTFFLLICLGYLVLIYFIKWNIHPVLNALLFLIGGVIGTFLLETAEQFVHLTPSPFRSIVFVGLFIATSFFVVTSSISFVASGLVLAVYLTLLLWQMGELVAVGQLNRWYGMLADPVVLPTQKLILVGEVVIFCIQTVLFIQRGA